MEFSERLGEAPSIEDDTIAQLERTQEAEQPPKPDEAD
jgi:hypothetical protein